MSTRTKTPVSFRLSRQGHDLLTRLADLNGITRTAMIEQALRLAARRDKIRIDNGNTRR